jgi:hypothetical protein
LTTSTIVDPALRFWLDYVEGKGGLCDFDGDKVFAVLPENVRSPIGLTEDVTVTADPEVAREDGAILLIAGHPALDHAVEEVLSRGDVAHRYLEWPRDRLPSASVLLGRARDDIAVDHGRIDLALEPPSSVYLPVLRVGVVVTYWTSLDDRFQERAEAWVDARRGGAVPERVLQGIERAAVAGDGGSRRVLPMDLSDAVAAAHALVEEAATARRGELGRHSRRAREQELARASAYYDAALDTIERRRETADEERRALLEAQAEATRVERTRRLREIEDKFRPRHEIRPFRLHLVHIPVVMLPVVIRRGPRKFPFELVWVPCASTFLPPTCPSCAEAETLVATKQGLGCRACLQEAASAPPTRLQVNGSSSGASDPAGKRASNPAPEVESAPKAKAVPRSSAPPERKGSAGRRSAARPQPRPVSTRRVEKAGDKLARGLWRAAFEERKWRAKATVPNSPMSAMTRLYGSDAALRAVGFTPGAVPVIPTIDVKTRPARASKLHSTPGIVWGTDLLAYLFTVRWRLETGTAMIAEVLVGHRMVDKALPKRRDMPADIARLLFEGPPLPRFELDSVARGIWDVSVGLNGLPFVARCLSVWWGIEGADATNGLPVPALAAAVVRWTAEQSRLAAPGRIPVPASGIDTGAVATAHAALDDLLGPQAVTWT